MTRLSVVIPALNEGDRLPPTLAAIADYLARGDGWLPAEVIVVDDGSTDSTVAAASAVPLPGGIRLSVLSHATNRGKGAAVRTGFGHAAGADVLLSDADLATPIEELAVLARHAAGDRVVIGSRAVDRGMIEVRQPWYRDLMGRSFNLVVQALLLPGIKDTQCGFKLFPGALARALAAAQTVDGFAYDIELLVLCRRWGYSVHETAVRWRHVEASRVRPIHHSGEMLCDLLEVAARRLAGRLPPPPPGVRLPRSTDDAGR